MAEHIWGSEEEFVKQMNLRAQGLGMTGTAFVNCNGLDVDGHMTTARDVAAMSRELTTQYPQVHDYSQIWMDNITHTTARGTTEFGLANTNKLIKQYAYATGLKTGSTSLAKFCVSATAKKDNIELIAVIMAAPDPKIRFADASALLNYGFANCRLYEDKEMLPLPEMPVRNGVADSVPLKYEGTFSYLSLKGEDLSAVTKELVLEEALEAPVESGMKAGVLQYKLGGSPIGELQVLADASVREAGFADYLKKLAMAWMVG